MTPSITERAAGSILGTLITYYTPQAIIKVQATGVRPEDLGPHNGRQQAVYRAILHLHKVGGHVDTVTVAAFLTQHGWLEKAGGWAYLELLAVSAVPSALKDHARLLANEGRHRRFERAFEAALEGARARNDAQVEAAVEAYMEAKVQVGLRVVEGGKADAA